MFVGEWIMELVYQILGDSIDDERVKAKLEVWDSEIASEGKGRKR